MCLIQNLHDWVKDNAGNLGFLLLAVTRFTMKLVINNIFLQNATNLHHNARLHLKWRWKVDVDGIEGRFFSFSEGNTPDSTVSLLKYFSVNTSKEVPLANGKDMNSVVCICYQASDVKFSVRNQDL